MDLVGICRERIEKNRELKSIAETIGIWVNQDLAMGSF